MLLLKILTCKLDMMSLVIWVNTISHLFEESRILLVVFFYLDVFKPLVLRFAACFVLLCYADVSQRF